MVQRKPLVFTFTSEWSHAVSVFACELREELGGVVVAVAASPGEDVMVYDSNVLVVLRGGGLEERWRVLEVARRVEEKFNGKIGINPLIVTEKEGERLSPLFSQSR